MSAEQSRAWVWLGLVLAATLAALIWWMGTGNEAGEDPTQQGTPTVSKAGDASGSASDARLGGASAKPGTAGLVLAATLVSETEGSLGEGRVELRCVEDGAATPRYARIGEDGRFVAEACPGRTCVRLAHSHFEQPRAWELEGGRDYELEVELGALAIGRVQSPGGEAIAAATVIVTSDPGRGTATRTDEGGAFELIMPRRRPCDACDRARGLAESSRCRGADGPPEQARILVSAPGFAPVEHELARSSEDLHVIELQNPAAPIGGRVLGREGQPFSDRTSVLAVNIARELEAHSTQTDAEGQFSFASLGPGRYRIRAVRDGLELASADEIEPGETIDLIADVEARGRTLELEIVDEQGRGVRDARVHGGPFRGEQTGADGILSAVGVVPATYALTLRALTCPVLRVRIVVSGDAPARVEERLTLAKCEVSR